MMKLNLNPNKVLLVLVIVLCSKFISAQISTKWGFGASLNPMMTGALNYSSSNEMMDTIQNYKMYCDSISTKENWHTTIGISGFVTYQFSKKLKIQTGITYLNVGHQRPLKNLQYSNKTYNGIGSGFNNGVIQEQTNIERNIDLNYRYQYLQIPVLFNYHIKRSGDFLINYSLTAGFGIDILLNHDIHAVLGEGFTIDDIKEFFIDSTGFKANPIAINFMLGSTIGYKISKKIDFLFQPMIGFFPMSVSSNQIKALPWYVSANVGFVYSFVK